MDERIKSLIEKRKRLGWTIRQLAEKADLPYGDALYVERGNYNYTNFSKLNEAVDKALRTYIPDDFQKRVDNAHEKRNNWNEISSFVDNRKRKSINKSQKPPQTKDKKWSLEYEECKSCGTTEEVHKGRGLCVHCYNRDVEKKQKCHYRKRGIAGKKITKEYLIGEYLVNQKSLNDIAKECSCTRQYIHKKMKEFNIPTRNQKSARDLAIERGKCKFYRIDADEQTQLIMLDKMKINEDFFSHWSDAMSYVLGFIYADGNLSEQGGHRLTVSQKEPEILEKLLKLMGCNVPIYFRERKKYKTGISGEIYWFSFSNKIIFADLLKLGLYPDKSLSVNFPEIPQEYIRHFIRGCWDGDGSVYIEKRNKSIKASFASGSLQFQNS